MGKQFGKKRIIIFTGIGLIVMSFLLLIEGQESGLIVIGQHGANEKHDNLIFGNSVSGSFENNSSETLFAENIIYDDSKDHLNNNITGTDLSQIENTHDFLAIAGLSGIVNSEDSSDMDAQTEMYYTNIAVSFISTSAAILPPPPPPHLPHPPENMELLKGGSFYMGSPMDEKERDESEDQRHVVLKPFYIGKYEVTQLEYQEVMGKNPSYFKENNLPVDTVSWYDAIEYCNRLSQKHYLTPAYKITGSGNNRVIYWDIDANGYRLPTEEEWEYACRAGTTTSFNTGMSISRSMANYFARGPVNVGIYPPNSWGLYDMHGNVAEWCWNKYQGNSLTPSESQVDNAEHRVVRGGSWLTMTMRMRSAFRDHADPLQKSQVIGFRIVRNE